MRKFLSTLLILSGLACYAFTLYLVYERTNPNRVAFASGSYENSDYKSNNKIAPVTISIPSQDIFLPVFPVRIRDGQWEATTKGVSYLSSSPLPGEDGNSILYGHNWPNLLGPLQQVKPGDNITIGFNNGRKKEFKIEYTIEVTPDQTHILAPSKDRRITVYTCSGFLDSKRFVAVGILKSN